MRFQVVCCFVCDRMVDLFVIKHNYTHKVTTVYILNIIVRMKEEIGITWSLAKHTYNITQIKTSTKMLVITSTIYVSR